MSNVDAIIDSYDFFDRVRELRAEAGEHGDIATVAICDRAINGAEDAALICAEIMVDGQG